MDFSAVSVALAAGMLAAFNPCGIALLPTYLALFLGSHDSRGAGVRRALVVGASVTLGFLAVFTVVGIAVSAFAVRLGDWLSVVTAISGMLLVAAGGWLLAGRELTVRLPRAKLSVSDSVPGMVAYGVVYATVSLSCTLPVFLAAVISVFSSSATQSPLLAGTAGLIAYALGMGLVLTVLALGVALFRQATMSRMRRVTPHIQKVSGAFLLVAGAYVLWYAWVEYQSFQGNLVGSGPTAWLTEVSGAIGQFLNSLGPGLLLAIGVAVLAGSAVIAGHLKRRSGAANAFDTAGTPDTADAPDAVTTTDAISSQAISPPEPTLFKETP